MNIDFRLDQNRKTVVVTGASGFIGGYLCGYFAKLKYNVLGVARSSKPKSLSSQIYWLEIKRNSSPSLPFKIDTLIHCGSIIPSKVDLNEDLYQENVDYSKLFFEEAIRRGVSCIVFMSSMSVYGNVKEDIVTEKTITLPVDAYGRSKLHSELILKDLSLKNQIRSLSIRLPGTVGKGSHNNFISDIVNKLRCEISITYSNPESLFNNIVHVYDLALFLEKYINDPKKLYAVTNLASTNPLKILEVINILAKGFKRFPSFNEIPAHKTSFLISTENASKLGYHTPTVAVSLKRVIEDYLLDNDR